MGRVIFGGIIGGIIAFVWGFISWTILPWHAWTLQSFHNQEFVSWVLQENVKKDGVYIISQVSDKKMDFVPKGLEENALEDKPPVQDGFFVYAQIRAKGIDFTSPKHYIYDFLTQFVGAALISFLLLKVTELGYGGRLLFVTFIGLIVGVLGHVPNWNWFGGGHRFLLVTLADLMITWFLAGLVMAALLKPKPQRELMM